MNKLVNMEKSTIFVVMDKQMVTGHNPQADAQKTASTKGTDGKDGQKVKSQARSLFVFTNEGEEVDLTGYKMEVYYYKIPAKSGFAMARLVSLLIFLSSCSYNLSPTTAQREQKKFERFKIAPKEALIYSGTAFASYGLGKHFGNLKLKD